MISLQRSMHSSQMYTPGPAISFLTCRWDLPQKLQRSCSLESGQAIRFCCILLVKISYCYNTSPIADLRRSVLLQCSNPKILLASWSFKMCRRSLISSSAACLPTR